MFTTDSGRQVGPILSGSAHQCDVTSQLVLAEIGAVYAHLHTHPGNSAFSDIDAALLLSWPRVEVIVVVALDGDWYVMSRLAETTVQPPHDVIEAFLRDLALLLDDVSILREDRPHMVWTRIAEQCGLRYDRVRGLKV
jgi:hypothetical protein